MQYVLWLLFNILEHLTIQRAEQCHWKHFWDYCTCMWKLSTDVNRCEGRLWGQHRTNTAPRWPAYSWCWQDADRMKILCGQALEALPSSKSHRKCQHLSFSKPQIQHMDNRTGPRRSLSPAALRRVSARSLMCFLPQLTAQSLGCQQALPWAAGYRSAQPSLLEDTSPQIRTVGLNHGLSLGKRNMWGPHSDKEPSQSHLRRKYLTEIMIHIKSSGFAPKTKNSIGLKVEWEGARRKFTFVNVAEHHIHCSIQSNPVQARATPLTSYESASTWVNSAPLFSSTILYFPHAHFHKYLH